MSLKMYKHSWMTPLNSLLPLNMSHVSVSYCQLISSPCFQFSISRWGFETCYMWVYVRILRADMRYNIRVDYNKWAKVSDNDLHLHPDEELSRWDFTSSFPVSGDREEGDGRGRASWRLRGDEKESPKGKHTTETEKWTERGWGGGWTHQSNPPLFSKPCGC